MKINDWDISLANARQWNVIPDFSEIQNKSEWKNGSAFPLLLNSTSGFKKIQVVLLVRGPDRESILENCSTILAKLKEPVRMELDGFIHKYYGSMTKYSFTENPLNRQRIVGNKVSKLIITLSCYEYAEKPDGTSFSAEASGKTELTVNNPGNSYTPCQVEITPKIGISTLKINGLGYDTETGESTELVVKNLTTGKRIVLDGETGLVTEQGINKAADTEFWSLPMLKPGKNQVTLDNSHVDILVKYRPRYM